MHLAGSARYAPHRSALSQCHHVEWPLFRAHSQALPSVAEPAGLMVRDIRNTSIIVTTSISKRTVVSSPSVIKTHASAHLLSVGITHAGITHTQSVGRHNLTHAQDYTPAHTNARGACIYAATQTAVPLPTDHHAQILPPHRAQPLPPALRLQPPMGKQTWPLVGWYGGANCCVAVLLMPLADASVRST